MSNAAFLDSALDVEDKSHGDDGNDEHLTLIKL